MNANILGTWTRITVLTGALLVSAASARKAPPPPATASGTQAPVPRAMTPDTAMGVWRSSFGAVKIERDGARGDDAVMGVWVYNREGQEVIGFFSGQLRGNVLGFTWHEPGQPVDLTGAGYLVFNPQGGQFNGKWWTHSRDRTGDWTGWRDAQPAAQPGYQAPPPPPPAPAPAAGGYGGQTYGNAPPAAQPAPAIPEPAPATPEPAPEPKPDYGDPSTDPFGSAPPPPL